MSFTKLDSGIVNSSIWSEPPSTRVLWITMLAMSDENGFVSCSTPGLIRAANISKEEYESGIKILESEDEHSRTPDNNGRRIKRIDGGWVILNYLKYRERSEIIKEQTRERVRRFRDKNKEVTQCNVTETLPSASASSSISASKSELNINEIKDKYNIIQEAPKTADNLTTKQKCEESLKRAMGE